ncbi:hypothetical protein L2728_06295 [Shewanella chilikensis]|jgi:hypothetical protein|uniref:hypothetical protein n=1 Tax=Shewanella chilikensis TaxID=558541 RepID=UPI00200D144F|nr:hypothetical protein [Shewanella chilikensis]MCL1161497.1 hypothetical protein [Shewanella chilikensis]
MTLSLANSDLVASGVRWFNFDETTRVKVAGIDENKYQIAVDRARRLITKSDARQSLHNISVSDADTTEFDVQCQLMAKFLIRDWDGVVNEDGSEAEFSAEAAEKLLKSNAAFFAWVLEKSTVVAIEKKADLAQVKKKS